MGTQFPARPFAVDVVGDYGALPFFNSSRENAASIPPRQRACVSGWSSGPQRRAADHECAEVVIVERWYCPDWRTVRVHDIVRAGDLGRLREIWSAHVIRAHHLTVRQCEQYRYSDDAGLNIAEPAVDNNVPRRHSNRSAAE
jgi:hypothetical protein